jgi:anti-anti-sigma factor
MVTLQNNELVITGPLTQNTVQALLEKSKALLPINGKFYVNLAQVERCDSASLAFLTSLLREAKKKQTQLTFVHLPKLMYQLGRVSGLTNLLPLEDGAPS